MQSLLDQLNPQQRQAVEQQREAVEQQRQAVTQAQGRAAQAEQAAQARVPLSFAVFDQRRRLVLAEGDVIDSRTAIDDLIDAGAFRTAAVPRASNEDGAPAPNAPTSSSFPNSR